MFVVYVIMRSLSSFFVFKKHYLIALMICVLPISTTYPMYCSSWLVKFIFMNLSKLESCKSFKLYFLIMNFFKDRVNKYSCYLISNISCCCIRNLFLFGHRIIHVFKVVVNYHLHAYIYIYIYNVDFEVLTLVYQVCFFVNHLTYESIVYYCFDFLSWHPCHNFEYVELFFSFFINSRVLVISKT